MVDDNSGAAATGKRTSAKCAIFEKTIGQNKERAFDSAVFRKPGKGLQASEGERTSSDTSSHDEDHTNEVGHAPLHAASKGANDAAAALNYKTSDEDDSQQRNGHDHNNNGKPCLSASAKGPNGSTADAQQSATDAHHNHNNFASSSATTADSTDPDAQQERPSYRKSVMDSSGWSNRNQRNQERSSQTLQRQTPERGKHGDLAELQAFRKVPDVKSIRNSLKVFEQTIEQNRKFGFDGTPGMFRSSGTRTMATRSAHHRRSHDDDSSEERPGFEIASSQEVETCMPPLAVRPKPQPQQQAEPKPLTSTSSTKGTSDHNHLQGVAEAPSTKSGDEEGSTADDFASDARLLGGGGAGDDEASDESSLLEPIRVAGQPEEPDFGDSGSSFKPPIPTMIEFTPMESLPDLSAAKQSRWSSQQKMKKPFASPVKQQDPQQLSRWSSHTKTSPKISISNTTSTGTPSTHASRWSSAPKKKAPENSPTRRTAQKKSQVYLPRNEPRGSLTGQNDSRWSSRPSVQKRQPRRASFGSSDGGRDHPATSALKPRPERKVSRRNSDSAKSVERVGERVRMSRSPSLGAVKQLRSATRIQSAARAYLQRFKYKIARMEQKQRDLRMSRLDELHRIQDRVKQEKKEFQQILDREIRLQLISSGTSKVGLDDLVLEETLRKQVAELEKENGELQKQRNRLLGSNRRIKASSESRRDTVKDVSNRLAKLKHINEKLNKVHKEFQAEYATIEEKLAEAETNWKMEKALAAVTKKCIRKVTGHMKSKSVGDDLIEDLEDLTPLDCLV